MLGGRGHWEPRVHIPGKPLAGCMTLSKSPTIPRCWPFTQLSDSHDYLEERGEGPRSRRDIPGGPVYKAFPLPLLSTQPHRAPNKIRPNEAPI